MNIGLFLGDEAQIFLFGAWSPFATSKANFVTCRDLIRVAEQIITILSLIFQRHWNLLIY